MANLVIASDEPATRQDLKAVLSAMGHVVVGEAASGAQALALSRALRPDAVFLNGQTLATAARALWADRLAPVVALAGSEAAAGTVQQAAEAGVLAFLRTPVRPDDLEPAIAVAVSRFREIVALETQVRSLTERMEARKLVGRAKAILMERQSLSEREAFTRIQTQSQALNKPTHEIARAIILASELAGVAPATVAAEPGAAKQ